MRAALSAITTAYMRRVLPNPSYMDSPPQGKRLIDSVGATEVLAVARLRKCAGN